MMERHILMGLVIPGLFLLFGGLVRVLVKKEWLWSNFYLGIDTTLAAGANGLVNIVDAAHTNEQLQMNHGFTAQSGAAFGNQMFYTAMYLLVCIGVLLGLMALHQAFEVRSTMGLRNQRIWRGICLGVVSNLAGGFMLGWFIYWKLKGTI